MKRALLLALVCVCALSLGCSKDLKKPKDLPKLNPTTITVKYEDGSAVPEATVVLRLAEQGGGRTWNVVGTTDSSGKAEMRTDGNWKGVPAGNYQGMVTKEVSEIEESNEPGGGIKVKSITRYVQQKYNDPHDSGLTATIQDGSNDIEWTVGPKIEEDVKVL